MTSANLHNFCNPDPVSTLFFRYNAKTALLIQQNCTVTTAHSKTRNLKEICHNADILVSAIGKPEFITKEFIKPNAIIIDVGINRTPNGLKGDVCFNDAQSLAKYITPVPGGVGPMTIAMLLENTYEAFLKQNS